MPWAALSCIALNMLQQQCLVGLSVQSSAPGVDPALIGQLVESLGKEVAGTTAAPLALDDTQLEQFGNALADAFRDCDLSVLLTRSSYDERATV